MQTTSHPTLTKRRADDRGRADHGWLQARFTFSFADYFDPDHMGFRSLRVMNNDTIRGGGGFPTHPHSDMEIFTYVIEGRLAHEDSMGNRAVIEAGNLQYMSAGSGVTHSEFNPSPSAATRLYQIWLRPKAAGGAPRYAEVPLGDAAPADALTLLFSGDGRDGSTAIRQDAELSFARVGAGRSVTVPASGPLPHAWVQVVSGEVGVLGETLAEGDGLAIADNPEGFAIDGRSAESRLLVFRLA